MFPISNSRYSTGRFGLFRCSHCFCEKSTDKQQGIIFAPSILIVCWISCSKNIISHKAWCLLWKGFKHVLCYCLFYFPFFSEIGGVQMVWENDILCLLHFDMYQVNHKSQRRADTHPKPQQHLMWTWASSKPIDPTPVRRPVRKRKIHEH